ncbi:MAG TPA: hypothetical protein VMH40_20080 [Myxococcaceae bacterium]|nr:hypothetical protein [Myxococcaceae bacterium]
MKTSERLFLVLAALAPAVALAEVPCERLVVEYRRTTPLGTADFKGPPQQTQSGMVCVDFNDDGKTARWSIEWDDGKVYRSWTLTPDKPAKRKDGLKLQTWSRLSSDYSEEAMQGRGENLTVFSGNGNVVVAGIVIILDQRLAMTWSTVEKSESEANPAKDIAPSHPSQATKVAPAKSTSL